MCISSLSLDSLDNLKNFKYKSTNKSLTYNYCLSPILNKVVLIIPTFISPNILTLLSLALNVASLITTNIGVYNEFDMPLKRWQCLCQFIFHFFYVVLDNLDGKQARRTQSSSPFGMLLDHGCDSFTTVILCYNLTHLFMLGSEDHFSYLVFVTLLFAFYFTTYEEYACDEMHFGYFNGVDEGNIIVCLCSLVGVIFGGEIYETEILMFTLGQWCSLVLLGFTILYAIISSINIFKQKGFLRLLRGYFDSLCMYGVLALPPGLLIHDRYFYDDFFWLIMLTVSMLFVRIVIDLQIKVCTKESSIIPGITIVAFNIGINVMFFTRKESKLLFVATTATIWLITEIAMIIFSKGYEILTFLGLRLFCIVRNDQKGAMKINTSSSQISS